MFLMFPLHYHYGMYLLEFLEIVILANIYHFEITLDNSFCTLLTFYKIKFI